MERSLEAYLDGEFDGADRVETEAHLAACAACRGRTE
ncbi:MAG: zf-HC2 domain-containing protein, partial [Anaeromyxobacteraceae bacterium]